MYILAISQGTFILFYPVSDFYCDKCSYDKLYNTNQAWNKKACMDNPYTLSTDEHVLCNSSSYCMFQEMYDISKFVPKYFIRSRVEL